MHTPAFTDKTVSVKDKLSSQLTMHDTEDMLLALVELIEDRK